MLVRVDEKAVNTIPPLEYAPVGARVFFAEEKAPYRVRARSVRYLVCTKPFNPKRTVLYTIVDLVENVRGPENLVFGMGAESDADCVAMVKRLHGISEPLTAKALAEVKTMPRNLRKACQPRFEAPTEVSHRNRIPVKIDKVVAP